jgi:hypothetical protein
MLRPPQEMVGLLAKDPDITAGLPPVAGYGLVAVVRVKSVPRRAGNSNDEEAPILDYADEYSVCGESFALFSRAHRCLRWLPRRLLSEPRNKYLLSIVMLTYGTAYVNPDTPGESNTKCLHASQLKLPNQIRRHTCRYNMRSLQRIAIASK